MLKIKGEIMQSKEIMFSWKENSNFTGKIIIRRNNQGDTFCGELACQVLHTCNKLHIATFARRYWFIINYVVPIISKRTGVVCLHNK